MCVLCVCVCVCVQQTWAAATGSWQGKQPMTNGSGHDVGECGDSVCARVYVHVPWYTVSVFVYINIHQAFKNFLQAQKQHTDLYRKQFWSS